MSDDKTTAAGPRRRVLIVEDEPNLIRGLRDSLEFEGFDVAATMTGRAGVEWMKTHGADCMILDLMLPDLNGYQVCEQVRAFNSLVPIIILTARAQESDKIRGLEAGADDYVTKPFSIGELIARINAIFRRLHKAQAVAEIVKIGSAEINVRKHTVTRARKTEPLSFYEVELVKLLSEREGEPITREEILEKIWGLHAVSTNRTVDNFVVKLRKKIEDNPKEPVHILTVHGYGYKLVP